MLAVINILECKICVEILNSISKYYLNCFSKKNIT